MSLRLPIRNASASCSLVGTLLLALFLSACDDDHWIATPPAPPSGLHSVTGDTQVFVIWLPNREPDLAGYRLWRNSDGGEDYFLIADIHAYDSAYYDPGSGPGDDQLVYDDNGLVNGLEYWYAVSAYTQDGRESELSYQYLYDVPRPEGQLVLYDANEARQFSGIDFSGAAHSANSQDWALASTDVWLEFDSNGVPYFVTPLPTETKEVRVQDYGSATFDELSWAPPGGYSRTGIVEAIEGHAYAFAILYPQTSSLPNYAKLWVSQLDGDSAHVWWGYQAIAGEPQLKLPEAEPQHTHRQLPPQVQR